MRLRLGMVMLLYRVLEVYSQQKKITKLGYNNFNSFIYNFIYIFCVVAPCHIYLYPSHPKPSMILSTIPSVKVHKISGTIYQFITFNESSLWKYEHLSLSFLKAKGELFGCSGITCLASKPIQEGFICG